MSMAELMCDRIFMIFKGRKVLDGSLDEIQSTYGHDEVHVRVQGGAEVLRSMAGVDAVVDHGNAQQVRLSIDPQAFLVQLATRATVQRFEITRPSLHDIFVEIARPAPEDDILPSA
jgi:ABC-2 type transport system ATP-binding protein